MLRYCTDFVILVQFIASVSLNKRMICDLSMLTIFTNPPTPSPILPVLNRSTITDGNP